MTSNLKQEYHTRQRSTEDESSSVERYAGYTSARTLFAVDTKEVPKCEMCHFVIFIYLQLKYLIHTNLIYHTSANTETTVFQETKGVV